MSTLLSVSDLMAFFKDEHKSIKMGEEHYKSGHVEKCSYSEGQLTGLVRASMRDKVYPVSVSVAVKLSLSILAIQCVLYCCQHSEKSHSIISSFTRLPQTPNLDK
jgi:hypothetical protein